jgi:hypothetical protein
MSASSGSTDPRPPRSLLECSPPADREAAVGDVAVLEQLQATGFPAEPPFAPQPLTAHNGQTVLVTEFVRSASKSTAPTGDPIEALGALVGRLHRSAMPAGAADRPAGVGSRCGCRDHRLVDPALAMPFTVTVGRGGGALRRSDGLEDLQPGG